MFVVLEGIDGCGKTTQADRAERWLTSLRGRDRVLRTHEPGGWDGGGAVREMLLGGGFKNPWSEWFLFMLDRCEHAARVIEPALASGKIVLSDRYDPSTIVYQLLSVEGIDPAAAEHLMNTSSAIGLPRPDVVFLLDIDVDLAWERLRARGKSDGIESRGRGYFQRAREGYGRLMRDRGADGSWVKVDAARPADEVFEAIREELSVRLEAPSS